jgi:hypothetical protein
MACSLLMGVSPLGLLNLKQRTQMLAWLPGADFVDWLWRLYDTDGHRWNLIVFSDPATMRTWTCADNNPYDLNDGDYIAAIHNKDY